MFIWLLLKFLEKIGYTQLNKELHFMTFPERKNGIENKDGNELTAEYIIILHDDVIEKLGGERGVRDKSTIDYLIHLLNNRKCDVVKMAALALDLITGRGHPFWDGNKRTGHLIADILLREEGLHIHTEEEKMTRALLKIANYECTIEEIEEWLRRIVRPLQMG